MRCITAAFELLFYTGCWWGDWGSMLNWATFTTPTEKSRLHTVYGTNSLIMRAYRGLRPSHTGCNSNKWHENVRIGTLHTGCRTNLGHCQNFTQVLGTESLTSLSRETRPVPDAFQRDSSRLPYAWRLIREDGATTSASDRRHLATCCLWVKQTQTAPGVVYNNIYNKELVSRC